eukprot:4720304-Alexandrium_andersonii.AAC.1
MDPDSQQYQAAIKVSAEDLAKENSAMLVANAVKNALARTSIQDAAMAFRDFLKGNEIRGQPLESI